MGADSWYYNRWKREEKKRNKEKIAHLMGNTSIVLKGLCMFQILFYLEKLPPYVFKTRNKHTHTALEQINVDLTAEIHFYTQKINK